MAQIECDKKGRAWVCPHCGRSNPDICLLQEQKPNGAPAEATSEPANEGVTTVVFEPIKPTVRTAAAGKGKR